MRAASPKLPVPDRSMSDAVHKAELFRGTVRSLARDAEQFVCELRFEPEADPASDRDKLGLVHYYLDYLVRLCDGDA